MRFSIRRLNVDSERKEAIAVLRQMQRAIRSDSRYKDKPAQVDINAPLALIQVDLKARLQTATRILEILTGKKGASRE